MAAKASDQTPDLGPGGGEGDAGVDDMIGARALFRIGLTDGTAAQDGNPVNFWGNLSDGQNSVSIAGLELGYIDPADETAYSLNTSGLTALLVDIPGDGNKSISFNFCLTNPKPDTFVPAAPEM